MTSTFANRAEAAHALARRLAAMNLAPPIVVLALPRGGVPIGAEVARALHAGLDLVLVRKIVVPWQPELAVAAVVDGETPEIVVDAEVQAMAGVDRQYIDAQALR
jgi:putative phosphoribosyl transferase